MNITLLEVFDKYFKDTVFNNKLVSDVFRYRLDYLNSKKGYLEFFGGNLLGTVPIHFTDSFILKFFDEVLQIDFYGLSESLKKVEDINQDFKISSDVFNLTLMYVIHSFMIDKGLSEKKKEQGMYNIALLFYYRSLAALISNGFKYTADPSIVQAAYASLNNKFLIKKLGSWNKVMDYRANALIDKSSIHYKNLLTFKEDLSIVYAINDSQGRIRDAFKGYYSSIVNIKDEGLSIAKTSSSMLDIDGEEVLKDKTGSVDSYITYIETILSDRDSFIKKDLVDIVSQVNSNTTSKAVEQVLDKIHENSSDEIVVEFIKLTIIHGFYLLDTSLNKVNRKDYAAVLISLKGAYMSSRSNDKDLLRLRKLGDKLMKNFTPKNSGKGLISSTRTSVLLYIMLRVLVGLKK